MKKNKYYTPEIEEFHVGFEYEVRIGLDKDNTSWIKAKLEHPNYDWMNVQYEGKHPNQIKTITVPECVRVKYLDREDIESFGFRDDVGAGIFFRKRIHTDEEIHLNFDNTILIERCCVAEENPIEVVFKGVIKNKSELKVLLKQLGV
ncbi:MAG: hypothetical protein HRT87_07080 [Legionellales bacterium]|nr:hypothetical protein [Legionellales bacterium]